MNKIFIVGGGKGGVGKSMICLSVLDILKQNDEQKLLCIETDSSNPDVFKCVNETIKTELCNFNSAAGYEALSIMVEDHPDHAVVINTAATVTHNFINNSQIFADVAKETGREIVMFWPINTAKDSLELLLEYLDNCKDYGPVYVVINTFFGETRDFNLYRASGIEKEVTGTIVFPLLSKIVVEIMSKERIPPWGDSSSFKITHKSILCRFRDSATKALKDALYA